MYHEYLIELNAYQNLSASMLTKDARYVGGGETRRVWGKDEYDALMRCVESYRNKHKDIMFIFKLSRVRPTGRKQDYPYDSSLPFFEAQLDSKVQRWVTYYMLRFLVADSEGGLKMYRADFDLHKDIFPENIASRILSQYEKQLAQIRSGKVKPKSYELKAPSTFNSYGAVIEYANQTACFLRSFGYRLKQNGINYEVTEPSIYNGFPPIYKSKLFAPVELIFFWNRIRYRLTFEEQRKAYGVVNSENNVVRFLGMTSNEKDADSYVRQLKESGLAPFTFKAEDGDIHFYVINRDFDKAEKILFSISARLFDNNIIDIDSPPSLLYGTNSSSSCCAFCGEPISGRDTLCSDCANNID